MQTQAEQNRYQVVVDQIIAQADTLATEWARLSRKAKLQAWADWIQLAPSQRVFCKFHRVISALEKVN